VGTAMRRLANPGRFDEDLARSACQLRGLYALRIELFRSGV
jgi:hypothetical protein